jgi:hypothetical protein
VVAVLMQHKNLILSFIYLLNCSEKRVGRRGEKVELWKKTQFKLNNARVAVSQEQGKARGLKDKANAEAIEKTRKLLFPS